MILTPEQFVEHNKKLLAEKEEISSKEGSKGIEKWIEKVMEFFQEIEDVKEDVEELEIELESKANIDHTHKEFQEINDKIEEKTNLLNNLSDEIKETKSSIKHYDDKPVLEQLKAIDEKVNWIIIPEVDLSGFLKEKNIKNFVDKKEIESLANKDDVYTKEETYNKDEVYSKNETYNKEEIDNKVNSRWNTQTLLGSTNYITDLLDVRVTNPTEWQTLVYNENNKRWENWAWWSSTSRLLELIWQNCVIAYNGSNQVLTETYADGTVTTYTYSWWVIQTTVTVFPDAETITATYTYTWSLVTGVNYT